MATELRRRVRELGIRIGEIECGDRNSNPRVIPIQTLVRIQLESAIVCLKHLGFSLQKTVELGHYLAGRTSQLNFSDPSPNLTRTDDHELRRRILSLSQPDARRLGIGKSTLHYLRKNAKSNYSLKMHQKVRDRLKPLTVSTGAERVR